MRDEVKRLRNLKFDLEVNREQSVLKKDDLTDFKKELGYQKVILDSSRSDKDTLLKVTQNKESNYKTLLEEKMGKSIFLLVSSVNFIRVFRLVSICSDPSALIIPAT